MKAVLFIGIALLSGCQPPPPSNLSPESRAALLGAMIARPQPQPYYQQPYAMPVHQPRPFTCTHSLSVTYCD